MKANFKSLVIIIRDNNHSTLSGLWETVLRIFGLPELTFEERPVNLSSFDFETQSQRLLPQSFPIVPLPLFDSYSRTHQLKNSIQKNDGRKILGTTEKISDYRDRFLKYKLFPSIWRSCIYNCPTSTTISCCTVVKRHGLTFCDLCPTRFMRHISTFGMNASANCTLVCPLTQKEPLACYPKSDPAVTTIHFRLSSLLPGDSSFSASFHLRGPRHAPRLCRLDPTSISNLGFNSLLQERSREQQISMWASKQKLRKALRI